MPVQIVAQLFSLPPLAATLPKKGLGIHKTLTEYVHTAWTAEQGLPQNSVIALCQTRDGYVWIGTQEGLARYDGVHFHIMEKANTPALKNNYITALLEDKEGALWIGTNGGGVCKLHHGVFTTYTTQNGLSNDIVRAIIQDKEGALWIGTNGGGVNKLKNGEFTSYTTKNGLSNDLVYCLLQDRAGALWIGTGGGVCRFNQGVFTSYTTKNGLSNDIIRSLLEDRNGTIWVGTNGGGVYCLRNGMVTTNYTTQNGLLNDRVYALLEDRDGLLWFGTVGGGISRLKNGIFESFTTKNGLSSDGIRVLFQDQDGSMWIGTNAGGLNRLQDAKVIPYSTKSGLSNDIVHVFSQSSDGAMWIGTHIGLNRLKNSVVTTYSTKDGLPNDNITSLFHASADILWIGTPGGLSRLEKGKLTTYTTDNGLAHNSVQAILQDRNGILWVGTNGGGLSTFKDGKWTTYSTKNGLPHNAVWALLQDRTGAIWAGTGGGGLCRFKDGSWTTFTTRDGLAHNVVYTLLEDRDGAIWIGTNGGGISRFKDGIFKTITTQNGLFNDLSYALLEDDHGFLWGSCNKGIYRISKQELNGFMDGSKWSVSCQTFGTADGMASQECNGGSNPAGWKTNDGRLWFPTVKGAVAVDPARVMKNPREPSVILEAIPVNHADILQNDTIRSIAERNETAIELASSTDNIEFHYTAPWFLAPELVKFRYMLEGYDKTWKNVGTRRVAYYTNLSHGRTYRFRVIACNNDGVWNEDGASVLLYIAPYFWETWWFYGICACITASVMVAAYRVRIRRLQHRSQLLKQTVAERTKDLQDANEEISRQMEVQSEQAREIELANTALQQAHEESESLLLNILPAPIAHRLKSGERAIAEKFDSVTVLFADIVNFTKLSARTTPEELVHNLNTVFAGFDALAAKYSLEKIKTIGDAYMVAGGLPNRSKDHTERVAIFALEIQAAMREEGLRTNSGETVQLRIGIHTGEAVAGVIGTSKFAYDLWGDTVNTASRMESHGEAGKIHCSEEVYEVLKDKFIFEERGEMEVKGKGVMKTYFLQGQL